MKKDEKSKKAADKTVKTVKTDEAGTTDNASQQEAIITAEKAIKWAVNHAWLDEAKRRRCGSGTQETVGEYTDRFLKYYKSHPNQAVDEYKQYLESLKRGELDDSHRNPNSSRFGFG